MTLSTAPQTSSSRRLPALEMGDHLDQPTFHARYEAMPEEFRAELIGGIVYVPSPLRADHGGVHADVMSWLGIYRINTPGTRVFDNATLILGPDSEPQPDAFLVVSGGRSIQNAKRYIQGPPEFVVEIASTSAAYDLHSKRRDYEQYGVGEYLVVLTEEERAVWFARGVGGSGPFSELLADADGIFRSGLLPGLWLDSRALFQANMQRVSEILSAGIATPEHADFVAARKGQAK